MANVDVLIVGAGTASCAGTGLMRLMMGSKARKGHSCGAHSGWFATKLDWAN